MSAQHPTSDDNHAAAEGAKASHHHRKSVSFSDDKPKVGEAAMDYDEVRMYDDRRYSRDEAKEIYKVRCLSVSVSLSVCVRGGVGARCMCGICVELRDEGRRLCTCVCVCVCVCCVSLCRLARISRR